MNENINLCEILKGHEGETFYSSAFGYVQLKEISYKSLDFISNTNDEIINIDEKGIFLDGGECCIFPSKDQRDWNKWIEGQKDKTLKTWSELIKSNKVRQYCISKYNERKDKFYIDESNSPLLKSALALIKIHQLIEIGYGRNVSKEEWENNDNIYCIDYDVDINDFIITDFCYRHKKHIAFHTESQAIEFLSYQENIQLLKDYFMI